MTTTLHRDIALPTHDQLVRALREAQADDNGGLGNHMWAVLVDRLGVVTAVAYSGETFGDQWPGSRIIAAQKANTANAFSTDSSALSTANLYAGVQPGGMLYGLQDTNPVNIHAAYDGDPHDYGTTRDFLIGRQIGGVIAFGGGLALYDASGSIVGGLGVSGDYSCADHNIAWKVRHALELDFVPATSDRADDNIMYDIENGKSKSGWGHAECVKGTTKVSESLTKQYPTRRR
ncbi:MAG TPA: heme-binding protein [Gemmatimonadaceae bacterium]|nr:heme-binding protein [Gemmatimonadaceae bacterium]